VWGQSSHRVIFGYYQVGTVGDVVPPPNILALVAPLTGTEVNS